MLGGALWGRRVLEFPNSFPFRVFRVFHGLSFGFWDLPRCAADAQRDVTPRVARMSRA